MRVLVGLALASSVAALKVPVNPALNRGAIFTGGACDLNEQSPIDLRVPELVTAEVAPKNKNILGTSYSPSDVTVKDKGYGFDVVMKTKDNHLTTNRFTRRIGRASTKNDFTLHGVHMHWGLTDSEGSEHLLNGRAFPMEAHFVHYNSKYADVGEALPQEDGLMVLGIFFEIGKHNEALQQILDAFSAARAGLDDSEHADDVDLSGVDLNGLLGPFGTDKMTDKGIASYAGSLTTPPCSESVTWAVVLEPAQLSIEQLRLMRSFTNYKTNTPMAPNYRAVQPLNGREIFLWPTTPIGSAE